MPTKVLCVDDNRDAAMTAAVMLEQAGCECRVCYDGSDALKAAEEFGPDVCVLDLSMPGMDGAITGQATGIVSGVGVSSAPRCLGPVPDHR